MGFILYDKQVLMKKRLLLLNLCLLFFCAGIDAQQRLKHISFEHFTESRGNTESGLRIEIPYSQLIVLENAMDTRSGFGLRMNFNGNMGIVDQMEGLMDGRTQVVLRREDGRNFYGNTPTLKAILSNEQTNDKQNISVAQTQK